MDYTALNDELQNDPQKMGYQTHIDSGNKNEILKLLQQDDPAGATVMEPMNRIEVRKWAANREVWTSFNSARTDTNVPSQARNAAAGAYAILFSDEAQIDMEDPEIRGMIDVMVAESKVAVDQADKDALVDRASRPARREEAVLGKGVSVTLDDLRQVLN